MGKPQTMDELFGGRHVDRAVIVLCVRCSLRFKLRFRDRAELTAERGLLLAHATIMRWVQHDAPAFERHWNRFGRPVGPSWRVDETDVKIRGAWVYPYRAVDRDGQTVDVRLSGRRDVAAAKAFLRAAIKHQGRLPRSIAVDGDAASHRAVRALNADGSRPEDTERRLSKDLNNVIEQDHFGVKLRLDPMLGVKRFRTAAIIIGDWRHRTAALDPQGAVQSPERAPQRATRAPAVWNAVLAAWRTRPTPLSELCIESTANLHHNHC